jgi:hypothetical protein
VSVTISAGAGVGVTTFGKTFGVGLGDVELGEALLGAIVPAGAGSEGGIVVVVEDGVVVSSGAVPVEDASESVAVPWASTYKGNKINSISVEKITFFIKYIIAELLAMQY